jgi:hypothetical protein
MGKGLLAGQFTSGEGALAGLQIEGQAEQAGE